MVRGKACDLLGGREFKRDDGICERKMEKCSTCATQLKKVG